jgi:hypothetical protein
LLAALDSFDTPSDEGAAAAAFGITPTTLQTFVTQRLSEPHTEN